MNRVEIMIVSEHSEQLSERAQLNLEPKQFKLYQVSNEEEAIELFQRGYFDIILVDVKQNEIGYKKLNKLLPLQDKETLVASFNNENSFDIAIEEMYTMVRSKMAKSNYQFKDNSFDGPISQINLN